MPNRMAPVALALVCVPCREGTAEFPAQAENENHHRAVRTDGRALPTLNLRTVQSPYLQYFLATSVMPWLHTETDQYRGTYKDAALGGQGLLPKVQVVLSKTKQEV